MKIDANSALLLNRSLLKRSVVNRAILTALVCCSGLAARSGVTYAEGAKTADPYTPQLPIDRGQPLPAAAQGGTHEVECNDPHTIESCYKQARALCHGAFSARKETDTEEKKNGKRRNRSTIALSGDHLTKKPKDPGEKRALEFSCEPPAAAPPAALK